MLALDVIETFSEKAIMLCKQTRKPYLAGMTTNGYLLTPEVFERLLKQTSMPFADQHHHK